MEIKEKTQKDTERERLIHTWKSNVYNCHTRTHIAGTYSHTKAAKIAYQHIRKTLDQILHSHSRSLSLSLSRTLSYMHFYYTTYQQRNKHYNHRHRQRQRQTLTDTAVLATLCIRSFSCYKFSNTTYSTNEHLINDNDLKEIKIPMSKSHHSSPI